MSSVMHLRGRSASYLMNPHVIVILALICLLHAHPDETIARQLNDDLESLHPDFIDRFLEFYHVIDEDGIEKDKFLNMTRVVAAQGMYLVLIGKMYLYGLLPNPEDSRLRAYNTESRHLAAYFYLRLAAEERENREAYYLLGVLEQFKLTPDPLIATHLTAKSTRTKAESLLLKYVQQSHLFNTESAFFMSAALSYDPAAITLGYMNKNRLGTNKNCSSSLAYYLAALQRNYIEGYQFRQVYSLQDSLEQDLYTKRKLVPKVEIQHHSFLDNTDYYDQETISATIQLADNYYMGRRGYVRNLTRAAKLYLKLANQDNEHGKVMAALCYFKGEGVEQDRVLAKKFFLDTQKDPISEFMLLAMRYFEIGEKGSRPAALNTMLQKYKDSKLKEKPVKLSPYLNFLIGSAILRGELKGVAIDEGYILLDSAAAQGNNQAKVLLAVLFADGSSGLKYGCEQSTKYLSEQSLALPFFKDRASMAFVALKKGLIQFAFMKYLELASVGYLNAHTNIIYLLQVYGVEAMGMGDNSWNPAALQRNPVYLQLRGNGILDLRSYLTSLLSVVGQRVLTYNNLQQYLQGSKVSSTGYLQYIRRKIITWASLFNTKNILKYYEYKLALEEGKDVLPILTALAAGDVSKLYVREARYHLAKLHHHRAVGQGRHLTEQEQTKLIGEYTRATQSELLGWVIFQIEQWRMGGGTEWQLSESVVFKNLMTYLFVLAIIAFVFYYLRSKRLDALHRAELLKQTETAQTSQDLPQQPEPQAEQLQEQQMRLEGSGEGGWDESRNQPVITQDPPQGVRIGSSAEE